MILFYPQSQIFNFAGRKNPCQWFTFLSRALNHSFICALSLRCHHQKSIDTQSKYIIRAFPRHLHNNKKAISPYLFAFYDGFYIRIDCGVHHGWHYGRIIKRPRDLFGDTCQRKNSHIRCKKTIRDPKKLKTKRDINKRPHNVPWQ